MVPIYIGNVSELGPGSMKSGLGGIRTIPTAIGVLLGLLGDRFVESYKQMKNVEKIAPLIIIELYKNRQTLRDKSPISLQKEHFDTEYWHIYKTELSKWAFINIVTLTEIYGLIEHYQVNNINLIEQIGKHINYLIAKYQKWYNLPYNKRAKNNLKQVMKQYRELDNSITIINQIEKDFSLPSSFLPPYLKEK